MCFCLLLLWGSRSRKQGHVTGCDNLKIKTKQNKLHSYKDSCEKQTEEEQRVRNIFLLIITKARNLPADFDKHLCYKYFSLFFITRKGIKQPTSWNLDKNSKEISSKLQFKKKVIKRKKHSANIFIKKKRCLHWKKIQLFSSPKRK